MAREGIAYCRVSGITQADQDKDGWPRQERAIQAYADAHGIKITRFYRESFTGTDLENRPVFQEMRFDLSNGVAPKLVLIEKMDRLARVLLYQESIVADFKKHDIELLSVLEPDLNSDDPTRVVFRQMMGAFAQYERSMIVARMQAGKERRRQAGEWAGGVRAYGHTEQEQHVIQVIVSMKAEGRYTLDKIARLLNAEGHVLRSGRPWNATQVLRVLRRAGVATKRAGAIVEGKKTVLGGG